MKRTEYRIIGGRPIKAISNENGEVTILAYNGRTGKFDPAMEYLHLAFPKGQVKQVSEETFEQYIEELRRQL